MTQGRPTRQESGVLAFNPPTDAEPSVCEGAPSNGEPTGEVEVPTVLTKLQKWVSTGAIAICAVSDIGARRLTPPCRRLVAAPLTRPPPRPG